jgi:hypothetical protein
MATKSGGTTSTERQASAQSIRSMTQNIRPSVEAALTSGSRPFITIDWMQKVSDVTRKSRSPVCWRVWKASESFCRWA